MASVHNLSQVVGYDAAATDGVKARGFLSVGSSSNGIAFEFRAAGELPPEIVEAARTPGVETLLYGVPYRWNPTSFSPPGLPVLYKKDNHIEVRLAPPDLPVNASKGIVVVYVDPLDTEAKGTPLRNNGLSYIMVAPLGGPERYFLYNGKEDEYLTAVPADEFIHKADDEGEGPKSRGAWRVESVGGGGYRISSMHNLTKQKVAVVKASGDEEVYGNRRLGSPSGATAVTVKHGEYKGAPFALNLPKSTYPAASSWTPEDINGKDPKKAQGIWAWISSFFGDLDWQHLFLIGAGGYGIFVGVALVVFLIVVSFIF